MNKRSIIPDNPTTKVPVLAFEDEYELNSQSAFNRCEIKQSAQCGCFHCGSTFSSERVVDWMTEANGEDTALCPHCNTDAVIVGTEKLPLSTALLSLLYMKWFSTEFKERKASSNYIPDYFGFDDYLRQGIPFRYEHKPEIEVVGEASLISRNWLNELSDCEDDTEANKDYVENDTADQQEHGAIVSVRTRLNSNGYQVSEFIDARDYLLPYEPWDGTSLNLLLQLSEKYGDKLQGLFKTPNSGRVQLFIDAT